MILRDGPSFPRPLQKWVLTPERHLRFSLLHTHLPPSYKGPGRIQSQRKRILSSGPEWPISSFVRASRTSARQRRVLATNNSLARSTNSLVAAPPLFAPRWPNPPPKKQKR